MRRNKIANGELWGDVNETINDRKGLVCLFNGRPTLEGYLMPNTLYAYIINIYDLVWLFFYDISTIVGY